MKERRNLPAPGLPEGDPDKPWIGATEAAQSAAAMFDPSLNHFDAVVMMAHLHAARKERLHRLYRKVDK